MSAADRLNEIEARANAATDHVKLERYRHGGGRLANFSTNSDRELVADFYNEEDREFYTAARTDVPALVAALRAVLELHREARNDAKLTPPCDQCHGDPGVHPCGCWADEKWPTVCAVCTDPRHGYHLEYPCPTVRAIEEALNA